MKYFPLLKFNTNFALNINFALNTNFKNKKDRKSIYSYR